MKLGELLVEEQLITPEQLEEALSEQRKRGGVLGTVLVRLGFVPEDSIAAALARKFGIPSVDLAETDPEPVAAARTFSRLPRTRAARLRCCPLRLEDRTLTLAMADPTNVSVLDEVRARTGFVVEPVFASAESILEALRSLGPRSRPRFPSRPRFRDRVDLLSGTDISTLTFPTIGPATHPSERSPEARLADAVVVDSARAGATAVHVELYWGFFRIRYRVEGSLRVVFQQITSNDAELHPFAVIDRILLASALELNAAKPQSGSLLARFESGGAEREVDFDVEFLTSAYVARLVLRKTAERGDVSEPVVPETEAQRNAALLAAARTGDARLARALLRAGATVDASERGESPVLAACQRGHAEVVDVLLNAGADAGVRSHGFDSLMLASFAGHSSVVKRLLSLPEFDERSRSLALSLAAREGHIEVLVDLLGRGIADVESALCWASGRDRAEAVRLLLAASKPSTDDFDCSLCHAAYTGGLETATALLAATPATMSLGCFVSAAIRGARDSRTPGSYAGHLRVPNGHAAVARKILRVWSSRSPIGEGFLVRSLSRATSAGNPELVRVLLEAGANPNLESDGVLPPLSAAIERNDEAVFELLLDAGAEVTGDSLELLGVPDRSRLFSLLSARSPIRCRPKDVLPALAWARESAHADFVFGLDPGEVDRQIIEEARSAAERVERALDLSGYGLPRLPDELFELDSFEEIDLSRNELHEIPPAIGKLQKLRSLTLSGNPLEALPVELGFLDRLQSLHVRNARFDALPDCVLALSGLECLDVAGNRLTSLPEGLSRSTGLRTLLLGKNPLETLPEVVLRMSGLERLDLSGTRLSEVPEAIGALGKLVCLDLSRNRLRRIPVAVFELPKLETVELRGNVGLAIPESLYRETTRLDFRGIPSYVVSDRLFDLLGLELLEYLQETLSEEPEAHRRGPSRRRL